MILRCIDSLSVAAAAAAVSSTADVHLLMFSHRSLQQWRGSRSMQFMCKRAQVVIGESRVQTTHYLIYYTVTVTLYSTLGFKKTLSGPPSPWWKALTKVIIIIILYYAK